MAKKKTYTAPQLRDLGRMSEVTRKSGIPLDQNQGRKPGIGQG